MRRTPSRLVVAAVVKDDAKTLGQAFRKLARLRDAFGDLGFAVYENDSTDGTKEALARLAREIPSFRFESEDLAPEDKARIATARHKSGAPCRIELLAAAREKARALVLREFPGFDCVLTVDIDAAWFPLGPIARNAERLAAGEGDCICANGLTKRLRYRDAFAFRSPEHPFGPELLGEYWWESTVGRVQRRFRGSGLVPVYSAFGGASLCRMNAFEAGRYGALADASYMEVQRGLEVARATPDEAARASSEPVPNTNYSRPIVCEHAYFAYSMRKAGFDRISVDPRWPILFWD